MKPVPIAYYDGFDLFGRGVGPLLCLFLLSIYFIHIWAEVMDATYFMEAVRLLPASLLVARISPNDGVLKVISMSFTRKLFVRGFSQSFAYALV